MTIRKTGREADDERYREEGRKRGKRGRQGEKANEGSREACSI